MKKQCILCDSKDNKIIHKGTRDNPKLDVLQCNHCGLVFLSSFTQINAGYYEESHMHDNEEEESFEEWVNITKEDDIKRYERLRDLCREKTVIDFGCGNGGFLHNIQAVAKRVIGIEVEEAARAIINNQGIKVYKNLTDCVEKADIITSFHVIEHLEDPVSYLKLMSERLNDNGLIIIETPNSEDALLSMYHNNAFADFTYWSPHIILYNYITIEKLANKSGLKTKWNRQIQRYPLSNHLFWLAMNKPGGHLNWKVFNSDVLINEYQRILEESHMCDTLFVCLEK